MDTSTFSLHIISYAFLYIVGAVAVYFRSGALQIFGVAFPEYFFQLAGEVIILCLHIGEAVDTGDDLSGVPCPVRSG